MADRKFPTSQIFAERLFLHVLQDLGSLQNSAYLYHRINVGRLLRQLLIDGDVLANIANRRVTIPIRFVVIGWGDKPANTEDIPDGMKKYIKFEGMRAPSGQHWLPLKLDAFLGHAIGNLGGVEFSPRHLIKYVANNYGGVHLGYGKDGVSIFNKFDHMDEANGEGALFHSLGHVTHTVLSGLLPLRDALLERFRSEGLAEGFSKDDKLANIEVDNSQNPNRMGTLSFWLQCGTQPRWYADATEKVFPPIKHGKISVAIKKNIRRQLEIEITGVLGCGFSFVSPPIPSERTDPDHGVHVMLNWDGKLINAYIQGEHIGSQKFSD